MKVLATAFLAPLLLIGAAYPETAKDTTAGAVNYRPCRPGPGDDSCIQLYERGVRLSYARWLRGHEAQEEPTRLAMGGPGPQDRAPSPGELHDPRCVEDDSQNGETRGM